MTTLTPQAEQALLALRERHKDYKERKSQIEAEVRAVLEERLSIVKGERDKALRLAAEAGVPRTRLGEAIGTSNYRTVQDILATTEQMVKQSESGWTLIEQNGENAYTLQINSMGVGKITGSAEVVLENNEIQFLSGDEYVVPTIYREGLATEVISNA
jgi:hypothetical protein